MGSEKDSPKTECSSECLKEILSRNPVLLAPMVRIGTLPFRLLCLRNGADLVWSEEVIDLKLLRTQRIENKILGSIDYALDDGTVVVQTCAEERGRNVLQIGSSSAERAANVVKHIHQGDFAVIDLNMGCPKPFSVKGGMGAALLRNKENARKVLKAMVSNSNVPVTCKIRILPNIDDALEIAKIAEECGVSAVTVHGRTPSQEPSHLNNEEAIKYISSKLKIPVICNGSSPVINSRSDAEAFRQRTATCGVMLARCALDNPSIFRHDKPQSLGLLIPEFVDLCAQYCLPTHLIKYTVAQLAGGWRPRKEANDEEVAELLSRRLKWLELCMGCNSLAEMLPVFGFSEDFIKKYADRNHRHVEYWSERSSVEGIITIPVDADAKSFMVGGNSSPKDMLLSFCKRRKLSEPVYESNEREDRRFFSVVAIDDKKYSSGRIEQRKRVSEQTAALAALVYLDAFI